MRDVDKALKMCKDAHAWQFRNDGTTPYYTHPLAVSKLVKTDEEKVVALLHDTLEDTSLTWDDIASEFGQGVAYAVECLTREKNQSYSDYLIIVRGNALSVSVKIADMFHNLSCTPTDRQKKKYLKAMMFLTYNDDCINLK